MRAIRTAFQGALVMILSISFVFGGYTYSQDVAYIESQMVDTARWVAQNVPQAGKIAAHDIGALGYFGQHSIVDLAGLISPEIIPIMNDENRLLVYMDDHDVRYLVAFPGWRPMLTSRGIQIFSAGNNSSAQSELGGNMAVYGWPQP